jgi:hypothetical protein
MEKRFPPAGNLWELCVPKSDTILCIAQAKFQVLYVHLLQRGLGLEWVKATDLEHWESLRNL